jgi:hypothetical protein
MSHLLQEWGDRLPRRAVEPETGNQDDIHACDVPPGVV